MAVADDHRRTSRRITLGMVGGLILVVVLAWFAKLAGGPKDAPSEPSRSPGASATAPATRAAATRPTKQWTPPRFAAR